MKKICDWLCPKKKQPEGPYDVHEETFQMDDNLGSAEEPDKLSDPSARYVQQNQQHKQQSSESLQSNTKMGEQLNSSEDKQRKYIESSSHPINPSTQSLQTPSSDRPVVAEEPPKPVYNILPSKSKKKKYNPEDYQFKNQQDQFAVKKVDTIKGQQFNIDGCKRGTYFIFDVTANIYIDDCQDCFVFAAPCQSSLFVRSCKNMVIVGAFGQFRTYNCHNSYFNIHCKSQPVIESSSSLFFSCLRCPQYPQMRSQFASTSLSPWNNNWSQIHNFTPKQGEQHYQLERQPSYTVQIDWTRAFQEAELQMQAEVQQIVPFTEGNLTRQPQNISLVVFNEQTSQQDEEILKWAQGQSLTIIRSSQSKVAGQKHQTVALLISNLDSTQPDYEQIGSPLVISQPGEIEQNMSKYFVAFKDER